MLHDTGDDVTVKVFVQVDCEGNVNVSSFGPRMPGCGGFIDIRYVLRLSMPLPDLNCAHYLGVRYGWLPLLILSSATCSAVKLHTRSSSVEPSQAED